MENYGKVAKCQRGKVGIITYKEERQIYDKADEHSYHTYTLYHGIGLDGSAWQSKNPCIIADSVADYITRYSPRN